MEVHPPIRAALTREFDESNVERVKNLRDLPYATYLLTPHWRRRRDARLRLANYRCERCELKADLQVHHVNYERLGCEQDNDLEVLCRSCHEGHHFDESRKQHLGIYVKLASDALRAAPFTTFSDLAGAVEDLCRQHGVPIRRPQITKAVEAVTTNRVTFLKSCAREIATEPRPFTKAEALEILQSLDVKVPIRTIPGRARSEQIDICAPVPHEYDYGDHDRY